MRQFSGKRVTGSLALTVALFLTPSCGTGTAGSTSADGRTIVTMATANQGAVASALKKIVDSFNGSQQEVRVELQQYPDAKTLLQKNLVQLSAGNPATMTPCQPAWAGAFARVGGLVDMSTLVGSPNGLTAKDIEDFDPALMRAALVNGKQYSLPYDRNLFLLYYNKDLLEKAGLTRPPGTWAEFAEYAGRLTNGTTWGTDFYNAPQLEAVWNSMLYAYGGRVLNDDMTKAAFNSDQGRAVTELWTEMVRKGHAKVVSDPMAGQLDFGAGRMGMYLADSTSVSFLRDAVGDKFEMAAAPLPAGPAGTFTELGGANICLFNKAPENVRQAGFRFISYLLNVSNNADFVTASNYLPNRTATRDQLADFYTKHPIEATAVQQLANAVNPPAIEAWPEASAAVLVKLMAAVRGDEPVQSALNQAESDVNTILARTAPK